MSDFPNDLLPSSFFNPKKAPVMWIGAGIPKRYVEGFVTWEEILKRAASQAGINEDQFIALRNLKVNELGPETDTEEINTNLALELSSLLNDMIAGGEINPAWFFDEDQLKQYRHNVDPLKLLICKEMSEIRFKEEYAEEIELFSSLSESIPAVITTNYDYTVEKLFGNKYKVYSSTDEYYSSDSVGIGEIYKIHGTIKRPSSIVVNANDYHKFEKESFVIVSKIVSLLCESPLVIMGYSMSDKMIRNMIGKMFNSFSQKRKESLAENILYIDYRPGETPRKGTMQVQSDFGSYPINTLTVDDFRPILRDLSELSCGIPVTQVRKIKRMVSSIVSETPAQGKRMAYIGIEGIDDVDPKRTVLAFTTEAALQDIKSARTYTILDLVEDVLYNDDLSLPASSLVDIWFESQEIGNAPFIPIFHYLRKLDRKPDSYSPKMRAFIEEKRDQYDKFLNKKHSSSIDSVRNYEDYIDALNSSEFKGERCDLILVAMMKGLIEEQEARSTIVKLIDAGTIKADKTFTKRAVTYLAFKDMK